MKLPGYNEQGVYTGQYGLKDAKTKDPISLFARSATFLNPGGYAKEALANGFGLVTKQQRMHGSMFNNTLVRLGGAVTVGLAFSSNDPGSVVDTALGYTGGAIGARVGESVGAGLGRSIGAKNKLLGMSRGFGFIGGGILGVAAGALASGVITTGSSSNNMINQVADKFRRPTFENQSLITKNTLTMRQRSLQQISKSALNNRGMLLGNEANVLNNL